MNEELASGRNSKKKKILVFLIFIIVFIIINLFSQTANASWWDGSWAYRQLINISTTSENLTNYQVEIQINLTDEYDAGKLNSTCKDIRFTDSTENLIDFWAEECNITGSNSTFWAEIPFMQNNTNTTIYMYYGNLEINSASNGINTFPFFEDFEDIGGWTMVVIDEYIDKPLYPEIADIDGDGNPDIVVASGDGPNEGVYWYEAPDDPTEGNWTRHTVDNNTLSNLDNPHAITIIDMDNNGLDDIISGGHHSNETAWYNRTTADGKSSWTKHIIDNSTALDYVHNTDAGDVDGDGDIEVFVVSEVPGELYMYQQNVSGNSTGAWNRTTIDNTLTGAFRVYLEDIDGDTDLDVVSVGYLKHYYYWYENPGWAKHQINEAEVNDSRSGEPFDVDMDGDLDIVAVDTDDNEAMWYEQNSSDPTGYWAEHMVDDSIDTPFDMAVADINGDGINDIVVTEFIYGGSADGNVWWYNTTDPTGTWTKHHVGTVLGPRNLNIYDLDEDGDLDIIVGDTGVWGIVGKLVWFVNDGNPEKVYSTDYISGINTSKWNNTNSIGAFSAWGGLLVNAGSSLEYLESILAFSYPGILHFEFRSTSSNINASSHGGGFRANSSKYIEYSDNSSGDIIYYDETNVTPSGGWQLQSWKKVDIYMKNSTYTRVTTNLGVDVMLNVSVENEKIRLGNGEPSNITTIDYDYDNVYIRNYTFQEPTFLILSEENETVQPTISFSCSPTSVRTGQKITCLCSATDNIDSSPTVSYTVNPSTSKIGTYTTTCTAIDDVGNSASSSISYTVSSGGGIPSFYTKTFSQDEKEFSEMGIITEELKKRERIRIKIKNQSHHVGVAELTNTTATIEIFSTSQKTVFNIGDENKFDVTDDSYYDIYVKLNSIENNKANLTIMFIHEEIPAELIEEKEKKVMKEFQLWLIVSLVGVVIIIILIIREKKKFWKKIFKKSRNRRRVRNS